MIDLPSKPSDWMIAHHGINSTSVKEEIDIDRYVSLLFVGPKCKYSNGRSHHPHGRLDSIEECLKGVHLTVSIGNTEHHFERSS